jgi:membrane-associated protease RseP (regulator of RpoE activity)
MGVSDARQVHRRWWLHIALLVLTLLTTTAFGCAFATSFISRRPLEDVFTGYTALFFGNRRIFSGLLYSIPVLVILLAHELGHLVACRRWGVPATLPFFLPSPSPLGTLGAFIRISSPIYNRQSLFDIGVSGPIAGFVALLPFLAAGVSLSRVVPGLNQQGAFMFGTPVLMRIVEWTRFPHVAPQNISLHPMAMAAWAGLLATAINLMPAGQLDGGHIVYAMAGETVHRVVSLAAVAVLVLLGFFYWPWWVWAALMFFFRRHPLVYDRTPLDNKRMTIGAVALAIFIISAVVVPVEIR